MLPVRVHIILILVNVTFSSTHNIIFGMNVTFYCIRGHLRRCQRFLRSHFPHRS